MNFFGATLAVVLCGCVGVFGLDCSDKAALRREMERCFSNLGLSTNGLEANQIQNIFQNDPQRACQNPEEYKAALRCAMGPAKRCLAQAGQSTNLLPDVDRMAHGITYICKHMNDVDTACVQQSQQALQQCAMNKALSAFSGNTNMDVQFITCKAFEITVECMPEALHRCSGQTARIFKHFTQKYLTPPACHSDTHDSGYRFTTMAPMTAAELVTVVPVLPHVECYTETSIQAGQQKCFERENIHVELPEVNLESGAQHAKKSYLDAMLANNKDIHAVCRDLPRYKRAMGCAMDVARKCMPSGYEDYIPGTHNVQMMLSELCENADDINQQCVTSKASALFDCGYKKGLELGKKSSRRPDIKSILCSAFRLNVDCQMEVLPDCGCRTTQLYVKISKVYLNPPACPSIPRAGPQCDSHHTDRFTHGTGAASRSMASAFLLVLAALAVFLFRL